SAGTTATVGEDERTVAIRCEPHDGPGSAVRIRHHQRNRLIRQEREHRAVVTGGVGKTHPSGAVAEQSKLQSRAPTLVLHYEANRTVVVGAPDSSYRTGAVAQYELFGGHELR